MEMQNAGAEGKLWPPLNNDNVSCATVYNQFRCRDRAKRGKKV